MPAPAAQSTLIPVFKPLLERGEIDGAVEALEMGWLGMGAYVGRFESALQDAIGATDGHVVAVSTGHAALHLALLLAGIGPGDEVITPSFNNIADFQAILAVGAEPVFCDIRDDDLCIDLDRAADLVSPRTKAVIVMDYANTLCDHDRAAALAREHDLRVIHDAAHSLGSSYKGRSVGSFSDISMFSFDPVKTITTIDGGAIVVRTEAEAEALREMRLIGMGQPTDVMYSNQRAWTYDVRRLGFRYHMANLHARIGLSQLQKLGTISETRRAVCRRYEERLSGIDGLRLPRIDHDSITPFLYYVRVEGARRDAFRAHLKERQVDTGIHWQPGHGFSLFRECRRGDLTVTERVGEEIVSLPLHSCMHEEDLERVTSVVREFFGER